MIPGLEAAAMAGVIDRVTALRLEPYLAGGVSAVSRLAAACGESHVPLHLFHISCRILMRALVKRRGIACDTVCAA